MFMKITTHSITTKDNPFDPFTDFDKWYAYDISKGYHTAEWLANLATTSNKLSNEDNEKIIEDAVDAIVAINPDFYVKLSKEIEIKEL